MALTLEKPELTPTEQLEVIASRNNERPTRPVDTDRPKQLGGRVTARTVGR